ncbi:MAG: hypothetical protein R3B13_19095 [Polyangiaceae bacterium]
MLPQKLDAFLQRASWALVVTGLCTPACSKSTQEDAANSQPGTDDTARRELEKRDRQWAALFAAAKGPLPSEQNCPDDDIAKEQEGKSGRLLIVEQAFLERFVRPDLDPYAGTGARFKPLTTPAMRILIPAVRAGTRQQAIDALWNAKKVEREYTHVGVLRATKRVGPVLEGQSYRAGVYEGAVEIFALGQTTRLCAASVSAESGEGFATQAGKSGEDAAWADFTVRVRDAVHAAVCRVSKRLDVDVD